MGIKAGITGHRHINQENCTWIINQLEKIIIEFKIIWGYSSLAIGADQLFANALLKSNIGYTAIIPCNDYEITFSKKELDNYRALLNSASETVVLNFLTPNSIAFLEAGKQIVYNSELLIAVWNNKKSEGIGGTADIVQYAINIKKPIIHLNPINKYIKLI